MSQATPPAAAAALPPPPGRWTSTVAVVVPISGLVAAIATVIITYQISRISDLSSDIRELSGDVRALTGDVRNTNGRIDQIYPQILKVAEDIGSIRGSLEAATQKIATSSEKIDAATKRIDAIAEGEGSLTRRIEALVVGQEAQSRSVDDIKNAILLQGHKIDDIVDKINQTNPLLQKNSFLTGATVFSPTDLVEFLKGGAPDAKFVPIKWSDTKAAFFFKNLEDSGIDFGKFVIATKDADAAAGLKQVLLKTGLWVDK